MNPRLAAAVKLIEKSGMGRTQAMRLAGYAQNTIRQSLNAQAAGTRAALQKAQDKYLSRFMEKANVSHLDAGNVAKILGHIVHTGNNLEKLGAISQHLKVILRRSDSMVAHFSGSGNVTINQKYVIPEAMEKSAWKSHAFAASAVPESQTPASIPFQLPLAQRNPAQAERLKELSVKNKLHLTRSHPVPKRLGGKK